MLILVFDKILIKYNSFIIMRYNNINKLQSNKPNINIIIDYLSFKPF